MAKASDIRFNIDRYFTQTRIIRCATIDCANRKHGETECNLKDITIEDGKCGSVIDTPRDDIRIVKLK